MKKYHPESSLTAEEKLTRVAAKVGLALPQTGNSPADAKIQVSDQGKITT